MNGQENIRRVDDNELSRVTGGTDAPDVIHVDIKTLDGDNDDYVIKLTDSVDQILQRYQQDK